VKGRQPLTVTARGQRRAAGGIRKIANWSGVVRSTKNVNEQDQF
jgi:hypothetical protein